MIGVLFATAEEARPLLNRGRAELIGEKPFRVYRLIGDTRVIISGLGPELARQACRELIQKHGAREVINAGVCGALAAGVDKGRVFAIKSVADGAQPEGTGVLDLVATPGLEDRTLVTVHDPVFHPDERTARAESADLVDMEGYAVAAACEELHVPCRLIKGVTDEADENGQADIREHLGSVSEAVAGHVIQALGGRVGAPVPPALSRSTSSRSLNANSCIEVPSLSRDKPHLRGASKPEGRVFHTGCEKSGLGRKLLRFTRAEHTIFSLPLLFAGAWIGAGNRCPSLRALALIALVGAGARTFGMALNRIIDRRMDAQNPRTAQRELPSGQLSLLQGYAVAAAGLAAYLLGCALLGHTVLLLSFVPVVPLALYSFLKRFTSLCHYGIGICLALAPLGAFVAVSGGLSFTPEVLLLALFTLGWISGFDIIYGLLDIDFDRAHGVRSLPAALGPLRAQYVAAVTHIVSAAALAGVWYYEGGVVSGIATLVATGAMAAAYWQTIPVHIRFFPISAIAGVAGALVVLLG